MYLIEEKKELYCIHVFTVMDCDCVRDFIRMTQEKKNESEAKISWVYNTKFVLYMCLVLENAAVSVAV